MTSRPLLLALAAALPLLVAGCGSAPQKSPPTGVDGLEIPTPSPDPDDFVQDIDNPYLPLRPGSRWVYESGGADPETITVMVLIYRYAFTINNDFGLAAAMSVLLFIVLGAFSAVYLRLTRKAD